MSSPIASLVLLSSMAELYHVNYKLERAHSSFFMFLAIIYKEVLEIQYKDSTDVSVHYQNLRRLEEYRKRFV